MTNTARKINPYAKRKTHTISEAARATGVDAFDVCLHPKEYRTGNYKKTKIGFFWWGSIEFYCPECGYEHWQPHIEF